MQTHPEPVFLADDGTYVDVTNFVRFELHHKDIRYGVLDLIVNFVLAISSKGTSKQKVL